MFSGLVQKIGALSGRARRGPSQRLTIATELGPLEIGESVAVSGACLTVAALVARGFEADISLETADKTTLGRLALGAEVNLERALTLSDRLGGHLVTGHVDGLATVSAVESVGDAKRVRVSAAPELMRYIAEKGSVCLDGVSLTVNAVTGSEFEVMLIPHTLAVTSLKALSALSVLNLEVDLIARYVVRWLESSRSHERSEPFSRDASLEQALKRAGIM